MLVAQADFEVATTVWTIRIALVCLASMLAIRIWVAGEKANSQKVWLEVAKCVWLLGSLFSLLHTLAAMGWYHHWSHEMALQDIAAQSQVATGVRAGFGIWLNYLFVALWVVDALWWVAIPASYERRARILNWIVYGYLVFIAINGAIIFETGVVRWIALAVTGGLLLFWIFSGKKNG